MVVMAMTGHAVRAVEWSLPGWMAGGRSTQELPDEHPLQAGVTIRVAKYPVRAPPVPSRRVKVEIRGEVGRWVHDDDGRPLLKGEADQAYLFGAE